ncbi:MAG: prenyltransferase [Candidatus Saccharimonadales bacterium]
MVKTQKHLKVRDVWLSSRPFWWITTSAPFFVGYLTGGVHFNTALLIGTFYFLFPYNLLLYGVNDIFDYESDIRNPRKAGIEGAVLARELHTPLWIVIILTNIPFLAYLMLTGSQSANIWLLLIVGMTFAYSAKGLRFKEIPIIDSLTSSFHYTSPFLFGVLYGRSRYLWLTAFLSFFVWAMANHAFGAIQDIKPDQEAGIESIATKFGSSATTLLCISLYTVAAMLPLIFFGVYGIGFTVVLFSYVILVARTLPYRKQYNYEIFHKSWQYLTIMNYVCGFLVSILLLIIYKHVH